MGNINPIKPSEVDDVKSKTIPDGVIEVFNELIAKNWSGNSSTVKQPEVMSALVAKGFSRHEIFDNHYLDVEHIYRKAGWKVAYDKPGYNENYDAFFVFSKKRTNDE